MSDAGAILYRDEIEKFLESQGVAAIPERRSFGHDAFACFTEEFIAGDFAHGLSGFQFRLKIEAYDAASNSCYDDTEDACFYARWVFRQAKDKPPGCSLAVGHFFFLKNPDDLTSLHSRMFFIVRENGELRLVVYEPQSNTIVEFTRAQAATCYTYEVK